MKKYLLIMIIIGVVLNNLSGCGNARPSDGVLDFNQQVGTIVATTTSAIYLETDTPIPQSTHTPTSTNIPESSPTSDWLHFEHDAYGIGFSYPPDWNGPEVHEDLQGIRIEIGTDMVYPFGTSISDRIYSKKDAYYIIIAYYKNVENLSLEEYPVQQPWSQPLIWKYSSLMALSDGEELSDVRDLLIREREITIGQFSGIEFISTLADTAMTERYYSRQIIAFDGALNLLHITGMPNNVDIHDAENWKDAYQAVDKNHAGIFHKVMNTIRIV
jgi:hypothetical protein